MAKKAASEIKKGNERGARTSLLEDLFYDFNRSRAEIYKMNFVRGIFFGLGSVLGGTVVVALVVWLLHFFVQLPVVGDPARDVRQTIQQDDK